MTRADVGRADGVTMIEVVVSLTLMAVLMTIFTTAVIEVYRNVNQTEAISTGQSQLNTIFLRLDKEVRYASGISQPIQRPGSNWYVEYLNTSRGNEICTQLRLTSTGQLQRRTWNRSQTSIEPSGWAVLGSDLGTVTGSVPFEFVPADPSRPSAGANFQQLRVTLAALGGRDHKQIAASTIAFAALNTSLATASADICIEGRDIP
jgi:prepilin-type N-terminal cleavage/methylation domain-containing protein